MNTDGKASRMGGARTNPCTKCDKSSLVELTMFNSKHVIHSNYCVLCNVNEYITAFMGLKLISKIHFYLSFFAVDFFSDNGKDIAFAQFSPTWQLHRKLVHNAMRYNI